MKSSRSDFVMMDAGVVAELGYRGLMRGKRVVIPGLLNKLMSFFAKRMPIGVTMKAVRKINGK